MRTRVRSKIYSEAQLSKDTKRQKKSAEKKRAGKTRSTRQKIMRGKGEEGGRGVKQTNFRPMHVGHRKEPRTKEASEAVNLRPGRFIDESWRGHGLPSRRRAGREPSRTGGQSMGPRTRTAGTPNNIRGTLRRSSERTGLVPTICSSWPLSKPRLRVSTLQPPWWSESMLPVICSS